MNALKALRALCGANVFDRCEPYRSDACSPSSSSAEGAGERVSGAMSDADVALAMWPGTPGRAAGPQLTSCDRSLPHHAVG